TLYAGKYRAPCRVCFLRQKHSPHEFKRFFAPHSFDIQAKAPRAGIGRRWLGPRFTGAVGTRFGRRCGFFEQTAAFSRSLQQFKGSAHVYLDGIQLMKFVCSEKDGSFSRESAANGETRSFHAASLPVLARQDRPRLVLGIATNRRSAPEQRPVPRSTNIQELRLTLRSVRLGCSGTSARSPLLRWTHLRSASCRTRLRFVLLRVC